tara:strand:- start:2026 stop:2193 length:168 start_codon:yes stop_codon:yes gene_type:complete
MINETKDSIANLTTIGAAGAAMVNYNDILTMILIISGIVLNVQRIRSNRKKKKED